MEKTCGGAKGTVSGGLLSCIEGNGGGGSQSREAEGGERELHVGGPFVGSDCLGTGSLIETVEAGWRTKVSSCSPGA